MVGVPLSHGKRTLFPNWRSSAEMQPVAVPICHENSRWTGRLSLPIVAMLLNLMSWRSSASSPKSSHVAVSRVLPLHGVRSRGTYLHCHEGSPTFRPERRAESRPEIGRTKFPSKVQVQVLFLFYTSLVFTIGAFKIRHMFLHFMHFQNYKGRIQSINQKVFISLSYQLIDKF